MQKQKHVLRTALLGMMMFAMIGQVVTAEDQDVDEMLFKNLKARNQLSVIVNDLGMQGKEITGITFIGEVEEMTWDFTEVKVLEGQTPILVQELNAVNCTDYEDSAHIQVSKTKTASHAWHIEGGATITVGSSLMLKVKLGLPAVVEGASEATVHSSIAMSMSGGSSWSETESLQWNQGRDITVAPRRKARADFIAYEQKVNANFTARVRCIGAVKPWLGDSKRQAVLYENWGASQNDTKKIIGASQYLPSVDNAVSSIRVSKDVAVECYQGKNYKRLMGVIDGDYIQGSGIYSGFINLAPGANNDPPPSHYSSLDDFARDIKNDKIKSVRVIDKTLPRACLYPDKNFEGYPICYMAGEEANLTDYARGIESIKLFNAKITLYDKRNSKASNKGPVEITANEKDLTFAYNMAFLSVKVESMVDDDTESGTTFNIQDYLPAEDRTFTITGRYEGVTLAKGNFQTKPSLNLSYADCGCAQLAGDSSDCDLAGWCAEFPGDSACRPFDVMVKADIRIYDDQISALDEEIEALTAIQTSGQTWNPQMAAKLTGLIGQRDQLLDQKEEFLDKIASQYATLLSKNSEPCVTNGKPQCEVSFNPIGYTLHELKAVSEFSVSSKGSCTFNGWETQRGRELWGKAEPRPGDQVLAVYECKQN